MIQTEKARSFLKVVLVNVLVILVIFVIAEVYARLFFPEFVNDIVSEKYSGGKLRHHGEFRGKRIRVPYLGYELDPHTPKVVILGDSISGGYGLSYEDIYWVQFNRVLELNDFDLDVVSISGYGNNLADSLVVLRNLGDEVEIHHLIYQFNYNDIINYGREDLKKLVGFKTSYFAMFRQKYLNYSAFVRLLQHYGGILRHKTSGSCEERGVDALGPYTWVYGARGFEEQSERLWETFANALRDLKSLANEFDATLTILVSPIVFHVDTGGIQPSYNYLNYDFTCATIDGQDRIHALSSSLGIPIIDPTDYVRESFSRRLKEGNLTQYFFRGDDNHFNNHMSVYVAEFLYPRFMKMYYYKSGHS